jgi:hypothetical protein
MIHCLWLTNAMFSITTACVCLVLSFLDDLSEANCLQTYSVGLQIRQGDFR